MKAFRTMPFLLITYFLTVTCTHVDVIVPSPSVITKPVNTYIPINDPISDEELETLQQGKAQQATRELQAAACDANGARSVMMSLEKQQTSFWCWAATGRSILTHYQKRYCDPTKTNCDIAAQCDIVNMKIGRNDCCRDNAPEDPDLTIPPSPCYVTGWPDQVLDLFNYEAYPLTTALGWQQLTDEICLDNPFPYVIARRAGGKHVLIVKGYSYADPRPEPSTSSEEFEWVEVYDPLYKDYQFKQYREFKGDPSRRGGSYGYWHVYDYVQIQPRSDS